MIRLIILILLLASLNGMGQTVVRDTIRIGDSAVVNVMTTTTSTVNVSVPYSYQKQTTTKSSYKIYLGNNPTVNKLPVCFSGNDISITLPVNSTVLNGTGSDPDGTIAGILWARVSGPTAFTIVSPNNLSTSLTGLTQGSYVFKLTVTDNDGATAVDNINVIVNLQATPDTTNTGYSLVFSTGYDKLSDIDFNGNSEQWGSDAESNHFSTTTFHTGPGSFYSHPVGNVSAGIRSEIQYGDAQTPLEALIDYWVMYKTFPSGSMHSIQLHPSTSGGSGTGFYHVGNRKLDFVSVESGQSGTHYSFPSNYTVPLNQWIHVQWYYKWGNGGYCKILFDGVEMVNITNKKIGDGSRPYLKVGQNMWVSQTAEAFYDDLKIYKKVN